MAFNITEDFEYCIWLLPEKTHEWYRYPSGFSPHLSVKTYLDYDDIPKYKYILDDNISIEIELVGKLYQTTVNNFYALQYLVKPICIVFAFKASVFGNAVATILANLESILFARPA